MSDPLRKLQGGEELSGLPHESWNEFCDAARYVKRQNADAGRGLATDAAVRRNFSVVKVKNTTSVNIPRWGILKISDPIVTNSENVSEFERVVNFNGVEPTAFNASWNDRFVVLLEPLRVDGIGPAVIEGAVPVTVNVTDASHTFAVPLTTDTTKLVSHSCLGVPILWKESSTGDKRAYVLLGGRHAETALLGLNGDMDDTDPADIYYDARIAVSSPGSQNGVTFNSSTSPIAWVKFSNNLAPLAQGSSITCWGKYAGYSYGGFPVYIAAQNGNIVLLYINSATAAGVSGVGLNMYSARLLVYIGGTSALLTAADSVWAYDRNGLVGPTLSAGQELFGIDMGMSYTSPAPSTRRAYTILKS